MNVKGLHASERSGDSAWRWTGALPSVSLVLAADLEDAERIEVEVIARAEAQPGCFDGLQASLDGVELEIVQRTREPGTMRLVFGGAAHPSPPSSASEPSPRHHIVELQGPLRPARGDERRDLGVALVEVEIRAVERLTPGRDRTTADERHSNRFGSTQTSDRSPIPFVGRLVRPTKKAGKRLLKGRAASRARKLLPRPVVRGVKRGLDRLDATVAKDSLSTRAGSNATRGSHRSGHGGDTPQSTDAGTTKTSASATIKANAGNSGLGGRPAGDQDGASESMAEGSQTSGANESQVQELRGVLLRALKRISELEAQVAELEAELHDRGAGNRR